MASIRGAALSAILFVLVPSLTQASVGFNFSLAGAGVLPKNTSVTSGGVTSSLTGTFGFGGGLLLATRFSPYWGLETGAVFLKRAYTASGELLGIPFSTAMTSNSLYLPLGIRIHLGQVISLQGGGFFDQSLESGGGSNYGAQGGLRLNAPLSQSMALFADARYNLGLKDQSGSEASDLILALVGLTFGTLSK